MRIKNGYGDIEKVTLWVDMILTVLQKVVLKFLTSSYRNSFFSLDDYGKKHNTLLASVRAGNVIGGGDWAQDRLIPDIIRAVSIGKKVVIRNHKATRPWQHVLEPLSGYLTLGWRLLEGKKNLLTDGISDQN